MFGTHTREPVRLEAACEIHDHGLSRPAGCRCAAVNLSRFGWRPEKPDENIWSLVCLFVKREHHGLRITARLIATAVAHAQQGATAVEAYPVDPDSPTYRFMGFVSAFRKAGFVEVGRTGTRRHVMRLNFEKLNKEIATCELKTPALRRPCFSSS